ncbi:MAG: hypothetical protein HN341_14125 [Verrucomicrobia bacterium]|jgi:hypothetical protein|nr:hypothetical protein [Verrucomicrobiota bacterium]
MSKDEDRINYAVADRDLKYYIFDWDDNILHMPTHIHLERRDENGEWVPHSVSTAVFSVIRADQENYRAPPGGWEDAFRDFRDIDVENENVFLRDTRMAIDRVVQGEQKAGPCFEIFRTTLIEGRLFAIVTARGHSPAVIREGVEYFIETVLTSEERQTMLRNLRGYLACFDPDHHTEDDSEVMTYYLNHNRYHGVMSPHFRAMMGQPPGASPNTEAGKQFAIKDFVEHVIKITRANGLTSPISVGFSDDDEGNVEAVEAYVRDALSREFPGIKFVVYYTSDPKVTSGRKVVVRGQLSLDL